MSESPVCLACHQSLSGPPLVASTFSYLEGEARREWRFELLRCGGCGMGRLTPAPSVAALHALYSNGYDAYCGDADGAAGSPGRRVKVLISRLYAAALRSDHLAQQQALRLLTTALEVAGGRSVPLTASVPLTYATDAAILDFGCGAGFWLLAMRHHGYENLSAFDIGQPALEKLSALGIRCFADHPAQLPAATFDCIRMEHVLEHLTDPVDSLAMLRGKLTPRGTIVLTVPNYGSASARRLGESWRALKLPHHLSHFTITALQRVAQQAGFQIKRTRFLPISELAVPRPRGGAVAKLGWRAKRIAYHARAINSPSAEYLGVELEQR